MASEGLLICPDNRLRVTVLSPMVRAFLLVVAGVSFLGPNQLAALPSNPQRPFDIGNCDEATLRLRETLIGNPLISSAEMDAVKVQACEWALRFCEPEHVTDIVKEFEDFICPQLK